uniref:Uncharacterized protein n=1 Tax=Oryza punctata TaxID=4537 RepID=A0A0E0LKX3_ORYPU
MACEEVNSLSEHHGAEVILYDSDEVHVVEDSFAGDTEVLDTQVAVDVQAVAVTKLDLHGLMESKLQDDAVDVAAVAVPESELNAVVAVAKTELDGAAVAVPERELDATVTVAEMELNCTTVAVPESELDAAMAVCEVVMDVDVTHALLHLHGTKVSTFDLDNQAHHVSTLMLPTMVPCLYGEHNQDMNDVATDLLWISHGYDHGFGFAEIPAEAFDNEKFEDVKLSMLRIAYPFLYEISN